MKTLLFCFVFSMLSFGGYSSPLHYTLNLHFKDKIHHKVVLQSIKGNQLTLLKDFREMNKNGHYSFPENLAVGMYRILFSTTNTAREAKYIDFIFNNEDIAFATDIEAPMDSLNVISSEENRIWFSFKRMEAEFQQHLKELDIEIDLFRKHGITDPAARLEFEDRAVKYNQMQRDRDEFIVQIIHDHSSLYAARLIAVYREPILDGLKMREERKTIYKNDFFKYFEPRDETLINSQIYTDKVYKYLMNYSQRGLTPEQQENEFIQATDSLLVHCKQNETIHVFISDYLVSFSKRLNYSRLNTFLVEKKSCIPNQ